ncbi:MAG: thioredoxin domain-containing protein [Thermodesulfobacteriota bacterium]|nr:MAG: thioredoxin domain-containing protein [Thermodesulfobacteriota bacterium]
MDKEMDKNRGANRLINEKSPYLLQHAKNPVDWYPWCDEAFERAKREGKPVLVSIGYSSCHWCHVMERESYEDPETARIMNERFINIKVDREEHPDIDSLYMKAVQAITGRGGWPLNAFTTPDGTPFYGGTYFPPEDSFGMPSFKKVLLYVSDSFNKNRDKLGELTASIERAFSRDVEQKPLELTPAVADEAFGAAKLFYDPIYGGFGMGTKFPHAMYLEFLLAYYRRTGLEGALQIVRKTLSAMASGGLYDHIGGGFHRYTVDEKWEVPHFEKMLYDNALLAGLYAGAFEVTGSDFFKDTALETMEYLLREMRSPEGGFYAAGDADAEGREGDYFVWSAEEVQKVLGNEDGERFIEYFSITEEGNFEGKNTLRIAPSAKGPEEPLAEDIKRMKKALLKEREKRAAPAIDRKVITGWNGLAISALARASSAFKEPELLKEAQRCAGFLIKGARVEDGRLARYIIDNKAAKKAALEDYALLGMGLLSIFEVTSEKRWLEDGKTLAGEMIKLFYDPEKDLFFDTAVDKKGLFMRERDLTDNDVPSGNSAAAGFLLALSKGYKDDRYKEFSLKILGSIARMKDEPLSCGNALTVLEACLGNGG